MYYFYYEIFRLIAIITITSANVQLLDYSSSQLVTIDSGQAKLQIGNFKIIHIIELEDYDNTIRRLETTINEQLRNHPLKPILLSLVNQSKNYLRRVSVNKAHSKRSLDFIGSAWKWIAGNPDHSDFNIIVEKINNVLENNNRQVIINKLTNEKINEVIENTNKISKLVQEKKEIDNELLLETKFKLETIKEELINIVYAIHWAKSNIINSYILSDKELEITRKFLEDENIPFINIDEALEFADIKIASNKESLIYIINLPKTRIEDCKSLEIRPIKKGKFINKIEYESILVCKNEVYGKTKNCKSYNNLSICSKDSVENITNGTCIAHLLKSKLDNCTKINNQHIKTIEEMSNDLIFLNQYQGFVKFENESIEINGTYLIKHVNTTIEVGNKFYFSKDITGKKPLPAILQPMAEHKKIEEMLSLKSIKELQTNELRELGILKNRNQLYFAINVISIGIIIVVIISTMLKLRFLRKINKEKLPNRNTIEIGVEDVPKFYVNSSIEDARF